MKLHQVSVMPLCNTRISRQVVKSGVLISHIGIRFKCEFKKKKKKMLYDLKNKCIHFYSFYSCRSTASYFVSSWKTTMGFTTGRCRITSLQVFNISGAHFALFAILQFLCRSGPANLR